MYNKDHHLARASLAGHGPLFFFAVAPATAPATQREGFEARATTDTARWRRGGFDAARDVLGRAVASKWITSWADQESTTQGEEEGDGGRDEDLGMGEVASHPGYGISRSSGSWDADVGRRGAEGDRVAHARTELVCDATGQVHVRNMRKARWRRIRWP